MLSEVWLPTGVTVYLDQSLDIPIVVAMIRHALRPEHLLQLRRATPSQRSASAASQVVVFLLAAVTTSCLDYTRDPLGEWSRLWARLLPPCRMAALGSRDGCSSAYSITSCLFHLPAEARLVMKSTSAPKRPSSYYLGQSALQPHGPPKSSDRLGGLPQAQAASYPHRGPAG